MAVDDEGSPILELPSTFETLADSSPVMSDEATDLPINLDGFARSFFTTEFPVDAMAGTPWEREGDMDDTDAHMEDGTTHADSREFPHDPATPGEHLNNATPWAPFQSSDEWKLAKWLSTSGLSQTSINEFLQLPIVSAFK